MKNKFNSQHIKNTGSAKLRNMRSIILIIIFIGFSHSVKSQSWKTVLNKEGNFSINFPFDVEEQFDNVSYPVRKTIVCKPVSDDNILYSISYSDYENNMYHSDSLKNIEFDLEYTQRNNGLKLTSVFPKSISGYPGREFRYKSLREDKLVRVLVYIVKNRVFELKVETRENLNFNKSINVFFNSFKLVGIPENNPAYLNLPSNDEIKNRPFTADFNGESEQRVQVMETFLGKSGSIIEMNKNTDQYSMLALGVWYSKLSKNGKVTEEDFNRIISDQEANVGRIYSEGKIISKEKINIFGYNGVKITMTYKLMGVKVNDVRLIFIDNNNTYFNVMAIYSEDKDIGQVQDFFNSFKLKK